MINDLLALGLRKLRSTARYASAERLLVLVIVSRHVLRAEPHVCLSAGV